MKTKDERIVKVAASKMTEWTKTLQMAQLRLRCAEIVFTHGSQLEKNKLEDHANRLYAFSMGEEVPKQFLE